MTSPSFSKVIQDFLLDPSKDQEGLPILQVLPLILLQKKRLISNKVLVVTLILKEQVEDHNILKVLVDHLIPKVQEDRLILLKGDHLIPRVLLVDHHIPKVEVEHLIPKVQEVHLTLLKVENKTLSPS